MPKGEKRVESLGITSRDTSLASFSLVLKWLVSICAFICRFISQTPFAYFGCGQVCTLIMHYALYLYVWICLCLCIFLAIHDIILSIPCLVPNDGGGAPYNLNFAPCIPKENSTMCICYGGALSLFLRYHAMSFLCDSIIVCHCKSKRGRLKGHLSVSTFLIYNDMTMFCVN
jgi:hypothetical protein